MVHYNTTHREYDVAFTPLELKRLHKIRADPDGEYHKVTRHSKTGQLIYPWKKMKEGDYFLIPVTEDNIRAKRVQMTQMARRLDIEIAMTKTTYQGELMLQVTFTYFGLKKIRMMAKIYHGKSGAISDGKWQKRRQRYRNKGKKT